MNSPAKSQNTVQSTTITVCVGSISGASIVTDDTNGLGFLQGKNAVVFEHNSGSGSDLTDDAATGSGEMCNRAARSLLLVIALNINMSSAT